MKYAKYVEGTKILDLECRVRLVLFVQQLGNYEPGCDRLWE